MQLRANLTQSCPALVCAFSLPFLTAHLEPATLKPHALPLPDSPMLRLPTMCKTARPGCALRNTHLTMACRRGTAASGGAPSRGASAAAERPASIHQGEGPGLQQQQACSKPLSPTASLLQDLSQMYAVM